MSIEFTVKPENEISMPAGLVGSPLTLAEIGAIFCLACLDSPKEQSGVSTRMDSTEMADALKSLKEEGILTATLEGNTATLHLNLGVIGL